MNKQKQSGFSMLELLVAMMIIAVIATLGIKKYNEFSAKARYIKAQDTLKTVSEGLDQYFLKHGKYPDLSSYESMVDANSPLVKENMIPVNIAAVDPWGNPFEGKSGKGNYELKCAGDPNGSDDRKPFSVEPGKISGAQAEPAAAGAGADKGTGK
jgi:general secretion pathway protein G